MSDYFVEKEIFYINSRNRLLGEDGHFSILLDIDPQINYSHCSLVSASIPKTFYSVQSDNNTFILEEDGVQTVITVPIGNYSRNSFKLILQTLLNSETTQGWLYTVNYENIARSQDTGHYFLSVSGNAGIQPKFIIGTALYEQLGFNRNSVNIFVANILESVNVVNLNPETTLLLKSDMVHSRTGILQSILSTTTDSFDYIIFQNGSIHETSQKMTKVKSNIYTFSITDEDSNILDLNGLNIVLTLMVFKHAESTTTLIYDLLRNYIRLKIEEDSDEK